MVTYSNAQITPAWIEQYTLYAYRTSKRHMQDHLRRQYAMAYLVIHAAFNPRLQGLAFVPRLACLFGRLGRLDIYTPHPVMVNVCIQIRACVDPLLCCKVLWRGFAPALHAACKGFIPPVCRPQMSRVVLQGTKHVIDRAHRVQSRQENVRASHLFPHHGQGRTHRIWYV